VTIAATKKGGDGAVRGPVLVVQVEVLCLGSPALGHPSPPEWVVAEPLDGGGRLRRVVPGGLAPRA
jgi:hypothetical protein